MRKTGCSTTPSVRTPLKGMSMLDIDAKDIYKSRPEQRTISAGQPNRGTSKFCKIRRDDVAGLLLSVG